jgi:hypothetical protein
MGRVLKILLRVALGLLLTALLTLAAWVASNGRWADAAPQPVPAALQPRVLTLAPQDNAFFDSQGLQAPAGESPNDWGQKAFRGAVTGNVPGLALPQGEAWRCEPVKQDCVALWRTQAAALQADMAAHALFGERCAALAARSAFDEPMPAPRPVPAEAGGAPGATIVSLPQFAPLTACVRWHQVQAVVAGDAAQAAAAWSRADASLRLMAGGLQTLIGQVVTWSSLTRHQVLLAQWAARQPAGTTLVAAWLSPWPAAVLTPRRWIAAEASFQRQSMMELAERPEQFGDVTQNVFQRLSSTGLGYLPQLTVQTQSAFWMDELQAYGDLQGASLATAALARPDPGVPPWRWRNSVGHVLLAVAQPAWHDYPLRQADVALAHEALLLSQQLNQQPAADRAAWLARQPLVPALRERLTLEPGALAARVWRRERDAEAALSLRFPLQPG